MWCRIACILSVIYRPRSLKVGLNVSGASTHKWKRMLDVLQEPIWFGIVALTALWMLQSALNTNRLLNYYKSELKILENNILREQAAIEEIRLSIFFTVHEVQFKLFCQLSLHVDIMNYESKIQLILPEFSEASRLQIQLLSARLSELYNIRSIDSLITDLLRLHQDFVHELKGANKEINRFELFLGVLFYVGLNLEEIAVITGKSKQAVGMSKSRLKQKLNGMDARWI